MSLTALLGTYRPEHIGAFMVASLFFFLYGVQTLMDINDYFKESGITDISTVNRATIVYSYMAGYYVYILRLLLALITIFILILIIRIVIATIISIFNRNGGQEGGGSKGQEGGAQAIMAGAAADSSNIVAKAIDVNMRWILGFIVCPIFLVMFLIVIPLFLFTFLMVYVFFFDKAIVISEQQKSTQIMITHRNFLMFVMTSLLFMCFVYCIYYFFKMVAKMKREEAAST